MSGSGAGFSFQRSYQRRQKRFTLVCMSVNEILASIDAEISTLQQARALLIQNESET